MLVVFFVFVTVPLFDFFFFDFFFFDFFFFDFFFFLLATRVLPPGEEGGVEVGVEGVGSTFGSTGCCAGGGTDIVSADIEGTTEFENSQTGNPTVNPGRVSVAI